MAIRIDGTNTAANPGITGADADTGLQFGTDEVNIVTGGSTRATVDSNGRLGVGTSSPSELLTLRSTGEPKIQIEDADLTDRIGQISQAGGAMVFRSQADTSNGQFVFNGFGGGTDSEYARIDGSGRVGIGNSIPSSFDVQADDLVVGSGSGHNGISIYSGTTSNGNIYFADGTSGNEKYRGIAGYDHNSDAMFFYTSATERMRISASGDTTLGNSGTAITAEIIRTGSGDRVRFRANANDLSGGYFYYNASNNYGTISDSRLKNNIEIASASDDAAFIQNIVPHTFNFGDGVNQLGFIAQNVLEATQNDAQKVAVANSDTYDAANPDCPFLGVSVTPIVAALVNAYKTSLARIETLETANASQAATIAALDARLTALEGGAS